MRPPWFSDHHVSLSPEMPARSAQRLLSASPNQAHARRLWYSAERSLNRDSHMQNQADDEAKERDDALIRETLDRKPSEFPHLLMWSTGVVAFVRKDHVFDEGLVDDYFGLAHEVASRVENGADADQKIFPVLFLYRHAVELALKSVRRELIRALLKNETGFKPTKLDRHELKLILDHVRGLHRKARPYFKRTTGDVRFISAQSEAFIKELDSVDETGTGFRYSRGIDGEQLVKDATVGLQPLIAGMVHIQKELEWLHLDVANSVDLWAEWTADMEVEFG
jgi:hypothetical protein